MKTQCSNSDLKILSFKEGHDGCVAWLDGASLMLSLEAEKAGNCRYSILTMDRLVKGLELCPELPNVIALSGWSMGTDPKSRPIRGGYFGLTPGELHDVKIMGIPMMTFSSSHERSHLLCAYALSPFPQGQPVYALLWEGHIGSLYYIDEEVKITKISEILSTPGERYAFLYGLADPSFNLPKGWVRLSDAGKLMALTAWGDDTPLNEEGQKTIQKILNPLITANELHKEEFRNNSFFNIGLTNEYFTRLAKVFSNKLFEIFYQKCVQKVSKNIPLLITGGCGLNCEWNSRFRASNLFSDVFIPPCPNDTGSAIGTAADARLAINGEAKLDWTVYCGEAPEEDCEPPLDFYLKRYCPILTSQLLSQGKIVAWIKGRYEMGPRALGARSILASPRSRKMLERLNEIKSRENFRPIAPVCLEEDMGDYFYPSSPSPFMLEFRQVVSENIPAVTHVDRSARPQSVNRNQNKELCDLLIAFKACSGISVLCNTSLNANGRGFINCLSEALDYVRIRQLDALVFGNKIYVRK